MYLEDIVFGIINFLNVMKNKFGFVIYLLLNLYGDIYDKIYYWLKPCSRCHKLFRGPPSNEFLTYVCPKCANRIISEFFNKDKS